MIIGKQKYSNLAGLYFSECFYWADLIARQLQYDQIWKDNLAQVIHQLWVAVVTEVDIAEAGGLDSSEEELQPFLLEVGGIYDEWRCTEVHGIVVGDGEDLPAEIGAQWRCIGAGLREKESVEVLGLPLDVRHRICYHLV